MKKIIGCCLAGLCVVSAWGAGAPLLLDWGVVDTASADLRLNSRGAAPRRVQFNGGIRMKRFFRNP
mgnify:CR=1 FL=1